MNRPARKLLIIVILVSLCAGFAGGIWFGRQPNLEPVKKIAVDTLNKVLGKPANIDFGLFWEVWNSLNEKYVDKGAIDSQKLIYGAIKGMVSAVGDPYTTYFEPVTSKKFQETMSGAFGGVGMEIGLRDGVITVISPIKDTPAFRAGIKAGDRILKIDDTETNEMSVEEAVNRIRGKKGTKVVLSVLSKGASEPRTMELIRDTISVPAVEWKLLDGGVAYLQVITFNANVDEQFEKAATEILQSDADRIILDVRGNPGGYLDSAVNLAGWFLDNNSLVVTEAFGDGRKNEFRSRDGNGALKPMKTVILINGGSASASEILAGALHDARKIKVIGEKSYGKGSVQEVDEFYDGSSLKVTVAKWLTPNGTSISAKGIEPDIEVKIDEEALKGNTIELGVPGKDPQLDKALEIIKEL